MLVSDYLSSNIIICILFLIWPILERYVGQKYRNIFVCFLVQMKTSKSHSEINWPLVLKNCRHGRGVGDQTSEKIADVVYGWSLSLLCRSLSPLDFANSLEHCNFWYFRIGIVELKGNSVRLGHAHPQLSEKWVR